MDMVDKTDAEMRESRENISGDIFIGAGETDVMRLVANVAQELRQIHPGIRYRIISGDGDAVKEMLNKGLIDFGLVFGPTDEKKYDAIPLGIEDSWGVILPTSAPLAKKKSLRPGDLRNVPLILSQQALDAGFLQTWLRRDLSELNVAATYTLILNAEKMVAGGLGFAMSLDRLVNLKGTGLCFRPCDPPLKAGISIISKKYQVFSPPVEVFRNLLIQSFTPGKMLI
jgi:DNA-binding transcriptional LysR family regulator